MKLSVISIFILFITNAFAQSEPKWDNSKKEEWPNECQKVSIPSSLDGEKQSAIFYPSTKDNSPLIVSLHTWSGNYTQKDTLVIASIKKNYNYIHPDFRGPNKTYKATGSKYVIQDIEDAIAYAIKNGKVDINNIHVIGTSGGGHAALLAYMNTNYPVKTFSAWVPIPDLKKWYYESEGRGTKYALDIAMSTVNDSKFDSKNYYLNEEEAIKRSPFYMRTPVEKRKKSKLYIYAGIHDGYTGSVPISQSLNFYNKIVSEFNSLDTDALIPQKDIMEMVTSRNFVSDSKDTIADRPIHYKKTYKDLVRITIFEGTHECLTDVALNQVISSNILAIGDSNGAKQNGWVNQLKKTNFQDFIYNTSISGNTIGFDNLNQTKLNTLRNIDNYMDEANKKLGGLDKIVIMLGTNDCKAVFEKRKREIPHNMNKLLKKIKAHPAYIKNKPQIYVISPPPCGEDHIMKEKYYGSSKRVHWLFPKFQKVAESNDCKYIDIYTKLSPQWPTLAKDGIHPEEEGQILMSKLIDEQMKLP
ncbi:prolyl oligopeptidase family serine peptidase [Maribacter sp. ANRC-HE7]|uniref:Prolyl oligopeptidase family serine peptidase n=1 Tax=Maribacter aquimaris TaxID=2737171 RepID=A0ABR7UZ38_9FLAO|nr:GDSL-type esterase/lipase family protein [Maribacter aquimaris]MBD0777864.1 prolyl oligopeptidase family serine peptidase [Maribacter aquimaris]